MNRIVAGHSNTYHTYSFDEALTGIARAGYSYVELSAVEGWSEFVTASDPVDAVRAKLEGYGLAASSMSAHVNLFREDGIAATTALIHWAAEYGVPIINCALASRPTPAASTTPVVDGLRVLGEIAGDVGVVLAVEVHGDVTPSGGAALDLVQTVGVDSVKINYDTGNVEYYSGARAVDDLPAVLAQVAHMHLKDKLGGVGVWQFPALGGGHVDFARVLELLDSADHQIPLSVELEFAGEPWPELAVVDDAMAVSHRRLTELGYL